MTLVKTITDTSVIDRINVTWSESPNFSGTKVLNCPLKLRVIKDFFYRSYWGDVILIARGINNHYGVGINESGFRFESDLEADEEVFEGVELFDPIDEVYLEEKAFERLSLKFFKAVIEGSNFQAELSNQPWWTEFIAIVGQIEARTIERQN